jgi:hypothetical protein
LGFYIPGLLLRDRFEAIAQPACAETFEALMTDVGIEKAEQSRSAYAKDFKLAQVSQRVPFDVRGSIDTERLEKLLDRWSDEKRRKFIALSGHWVHILDEYRRRCGFEISAGLLYMDGSLAPSWLQTRRIDPTYAARYSELPLLSRSPPAVLRHIAVSEPSVTWSVRENRLIVHGGGWGMGDFANAAEQLKSSNYDVLNAMYPAPGVDLSIGQRHLADNPNWRVWHPTESGELEFPPYGYVDRDGWHDGGYHGQTHGLYQTIANSRAIVSKPGAGTLIDSFASETPVVLLTPLGRHETDSGNIWSQLGFGITIEDWQSSECDPEILFQLHKNIAMAKLNCPDLAEWCLENIFGDR